MPLVLHRENLGSVWIIIKNKKFLREKEREAMPLRSPSLKHLLRLPFLWGEEVFLPTLEEEEVLLPPSSSSSSYISLCNSSCCNFGRRREKFFYFSRSVFHSLLHTWPNQVSCKLSCKANESHTAIQASLQFNSMLILFSLIQSSNLRARDWASAGIIQATYN